MVTYFVFNPPSPNRLRAVHRLVFTTAQDLTQDLEDYHFLIQIHSVNNVRVCGNGSMVKHLLHKHEDQGSDPKSPAAVLSGCYCLPAIPALEDGDRGSTERAS